MCVLCGELVTQVHWAEEQADDGQTIAVVGDGRQRQRRRDRLHRIRLANQILSYYGLKLDDWNGASYILRDKKGGTEMVQNVGEVWRAAEKLAHSPLNPLDPHLLKHLSKSQGS